jgi:hypothetical protein
MNPDDLSTVQRSWAELRGQRPSMLDALRDRFEITAPPSIDPELRARWLFGAVEELVDLLPVPSVLAARARDVGATWPDPLTAPSFAIEGQAWMAAAADCLPAWSASTDCAWRQAWLLLSDVVAAETLSPFTDGPCHLPSEQAEPERERLRPA